MKFYTTHFVMTILFFSCSQPQQPITTGVSEELAKYRETTISAIKYDLSFRIPASLNEKIEASASIQFNLKDNKQNLQLDFKGDSTTSYSVVCNGKTSAIRIQKGHLVVDKTELKTGANEINLKFICPDWSMNRNPEFMYTLFVPDRASTAFPCFDQPRLKAQFKLQLQIPVDWKAVANGPLESEKSTDSTKTVTFKLTHPLPSYLFSFTAGKFDTISRTQNGRTCVLFHREKEEDLKSNTDSIFSLVFRSIEWIEQYTAIPYPFEKYDLVAIPSFQYNGMEHPGASLYRASSLFLDAHPTQQQLLKRANLISHEIAHIWFGDLVTMPWFNEVWLKEVFANFIADKIVSPMFPEFNFDLQFLLAHYDASYSVDRTSGANAIGQKLRNMNEAGSLYGSIIYHKAPVVMRMLEQKTSEENLRKGLRKYLTENAYGNAGWKELIEILNVQKTEELPNWSNSWINEAGRPHLKATVDGKNLNIEQYDPFEKNRIWPMEVELAFPENAKIKRQRLTFNTKKIQLKNVFPGIKPDWIYLNSRGNLYAFNELDSSSANFFLDHFSSLSDDLLRASALTDLTENLQEGQLDPTRYLKALLTQLPIEHNAMIYERLLSYIENCYLYKIGQAQQKEHIRKLEKVLWNEYAIKKDHQTALVNSLIKMAETESSLTKFLEYINKPKTHPDLKLSLDQQNDLALQLALRMPQNATKILDDQELRITNPDKKAWFQFVRQSLNPERSERDSFFRQLLEDKNREHEPWVDQAMAYLNHPTRQTEALDYIRPALDELQEIQKTGDIFFPKSWLDNLLKGHNNQEAAAIVRQFLDDNPNYPENLKMKILQSADHLMRRYTDLNALPVSVE